MNIKLSHNDLGYFLQLPGGVFQALPSDHPAISHGTVIIREPINPNFWDDRYIGTEVRTSLCPVQVLGGNILGAALPTTEFVQLRNGRLVPAPEPEFHV